MAGGKKIDSGLKFMHQAFGMRSLHFGLFAEDMPHTLDGLKEAQENYTRTLVDLVPKKAKTVLDVGCGVGGTSKALKEKGFDVEGLSPDPYHEEQFPVTCGPDIFHPPNPMVAMTHGAFGTSNSLRQVFIRCTRFRS